MSKVKMQNVRLSFPSVFQHGTFGGESNGKFEATFILDKVDHADLITSIKKQIETLMAEAKIKVGSDKICLKDGDELVRPELEGKYTIKATSKKRPLIINRDKSPIIEEDNIIYAGCHVHGIISLWCQNNQWGKRVNAQLDGIQFFKDGEAFGDGGLALNEFDVFGEWVHDDDIPF